MNWFQTEEQKDIFGLYSFIFSYICSFVLLSEKLNYLFQSSLLLKCSFRTNFMSCSAMMCTNSSKLVCCGFQLSNVLALVGSPSNCSTSEGRKYLGSTSTSTLPVWLSMPFSFTPSPSQRSSMPVSLKASVANSRTVCISPVAITKSSGVSCCRISHIHST